jgi:adenylate kinase
MCPLDSCAGEMVKKSQSRVEKGIVIFGPPGVGKGAQANIITRKSGLVHLSTGDLIREEIRAGTELGRRVKEAVDRGQFADDETVLKVVMTSIDRPEFKGGFVMDGFPRNIGQAKMFDKLLADRGRQVNLALLINAPDAVVLRRLAGRLVCSKCGETYNREGRKPKVRGLCDRCQGPVTRRPDDEPKVQRARIEVYHDQTAPLEDYYRKKGILQEVNGNQSIEDVASEIQKVINALD